MKRFIVKILIYFGIILSLVAILWRCMVSVENDYSIHSHETNMYRQIERLDTLRSPKIIILGGSGCGFGINSRMLQEHFKMNVSNTGTHAGLGLRLQVNLFRDYISPGDIVVVIPEYEQFVNLFWGDETALRILTNTYQDGYKHFSVMQQFHLFPYVAQAFQDAIKMRNKSIADSTNPYSAAALNEYGDVENYEHRGHMDKKWKPNRLKGDIQELPFIFLKEFEQECIAKQARLLIFFPAFRQGAFECNEKEIEQICHRLSEHNLPIVGTPKTYMLPDSLYYDTDYHLTYEGVVIRTNKLITDMDSLGITHLH